MCIRDSSRCRTLRPLSTEALRKALFPSPILGRRSSVCSFLNRLLKFRPVRLLKDLEFHRSGVTRTGAHSGRFSSGQSYDRRDRSVAGSTSPVVEPLSTPTLSDPRSPAKKVPYEQPAWARAADMGYASQGGDNNSIRNEENPMRKIALLVCIPVSYTHLRAHETRHDL